MRYYTEIVNEFLVVLNDISKTRNMRVNTIYTHTHTYVYVYIIYNTRTHIIFYCSLSQELIKYKTVVVYESVNDSLSFAHAHTTADKANNNIIICHTIVCV